LGGIDNQLDVTCQNSGEYMETEMKANSNIHLRNRVERSYFAQKQSMTITEEMLSALSSYGDSF
jgi:hypothetical protein